jgi:HNH endonuclease
MSIYSSTDHRKIYETYIGPIPKDEDGRSYEIHHIDGNHNNNELSNLLCVSIKEHYEIHKSQGDVKACLIMSQRMKLSPEEKSRLAKLSNAGKNNPMYGTIWINNGTENKKIRGEIPNGWARGRIIPKEHADKFNKRSKQGTNNSRFDRTIYCFENVISKETVLSTAYEFGIKFNISTKIIRGMRRNEIPQYNNWRIVFT